MRRIVILGPQRLRPNLVQEMERLDIDGRVALISAGWQEREAEDEELRKHVRRDVVNLRLHGRAEEVFAEDQDFFRAHRDRQTRLQELQRLYRYRLDFAMEPARELLARHRSSPLLIDERVDVIRTLRQLDERHLGRIQELHVRFEEEHHPWKRDAIRKRRDELRGILESSAALAIAGGHVAVLLNRIRLFGLLDLLPFEKPIFAWSAGAMVGAEQIVLFHDCPPQGAGNAEVFERGLGLCPELIPLPHAERRLRLDDPVRVALMARRFMPSAAVPLNTGDALEWDGDRWLPRPESRRLWEDGRLIPLEAA